MSIPLRSVGFTLALATLVACDPQPDPIYEPTCEDAPVAPAGDLDPVIGPDGATFEVGAETAIAATDAWSMSPHSAVAADGSTWISWFSLTEAGMSMRVQRLDPSGAPSFDADGLQVSLAPDLSWVMDHALLVADDGSAIVVFTDTHTGLWEVHAARISPDGAQRWGEGGVTVSGGDTGDEGTPSAALLADGDLAVVWSHRPEDTDDVSTVRAARVSEDGELRWPDALELPCDAGYCTDAVVVPLEGSDVGVAYLSASEFMSDERDVFARRIDADGCPVWDEDVQVDGELRVPYYTEISAVAVADGLAVAWDALDTDDRLVASVQRVSDDGAVAFGAGGRAVSAADDRMQAGAGLSYDATTDEIVLIWTEANLAQTQFGVRAQRLSADGARQWGDEGLEIVALSRTGAVPVATRVWGAQTLIWFQEQPVDEAAGFGGYESRVGLVSVDAEGGLSSTAFLSAYASAKSHVRVSETSASGVWFTSWDDDRQDDGDVMGAAVVAGAE